jgi:hypothetical protein
VIINLSDFIPHLILFYFYQILIPILSFRFHVIFIWLPEREKSYKKVHALAEQGHVDALVYVTEALFFGNMGKHEASGHSRRKVLSYEYFEGFFWSILCCIVLLLFILLWFILNEEDNN